MILRRAVSAMARSRMVVLVTGGYRGRSLRRLLVNERVGIAVAFISREANIGRCPWLGVNLKLGGGCGKSEF